MASKPTVEQDRQRSELLKKQLNAMSEDFEFMKKNREDWKKQLEARFQDIERKIENSKQFITNEAKRTNDTLLAFQHKFEFEISETKRELTEDIRGLSSTTDQRFAKKDQQIEDLDKRIQAEKKERNAQHQDGVRETNAKIEGLNDGLEKEKEARLKSEKQNMGKINESLFVLKQQVKEQRDQRNLKIRELQKNTEAELSSQRKFNEQFHNKTFRDFSQGLEDLRKEMDARFSSKDEIINSISKVVKTLQETLRHPN